jgi:site-specific recombinase XerD
MKPVKLYQFNNIQEDLLFWIKHFLVNKLAELDKSKIRDDFDIGLYFKKIRECKDYECIKDIAKGIKKDVGSFYNLTRGIDRFLAFIPKMKLEQITDITSSIFNDDFINRELDGLGKATKRDTKSAVKQLFDFIEENNIYYDDGKPFLFNITKDIDGKTIVNQRLKQFKKVPQWLDAEELEILKSNLLKYDNFKEKDKDFQRAKEVLIMKILIYTGMSSKELVELQLSNIQEVEKYDKKYIVFYVNQNDAEPKKRDIPVPRKLIIRDLNRYLELRDNKEHDYLFYDSDKPIELLKTQYVLDTVRNFINFSKIYKPKVTVDIMRNTYAVTLRRTKNAQEIEIREMMGYDEKSTKIKELLSHADVGIVVATDKFDIVEFL